ncbi:MAG: septum formation inhibitor Maf [Betaproteobacteria bacterium SG8_41]|nr:MAG: septum formation inhibitor Maf [Betaproteobacteria bacterium SG8_41]
MNSRPLVLASTSPYRRELLARLRLPFEVGAPGVNEAALPGEAARDTALRLAQLKARAVAPKYPGALVIGSDQVAALDGECLGKPGSHEMAVSQLRAMRGRRVTFHTALALLNTASGGLQLDEVPTAVYFRDCSDEEIERYLAAERPYDCTGSAKIEGLGIALVERMVSDDPSALMGLPLMRLTAMLKQEGVSVL